VWLRVHRKIDISKKSSSSILYMLSLPLMFLMGYNFIVKEVVWAIVLRYVRFNDRRRLWSRRGTLAPFYHLVRVMHVPSELGSGVDTKQDR
jgi:hypothetical protein